MTLRREDNKVDMKPRFRIRLLVLSLVSLIIGVIVDILLPFNYGVNTVRGVIAIIMAVSLFSLGYLISTSITAENMSRNSIYVPFKNRFSYKQRTNLSILMGIVVVVFVLLGGNPSPIYTIKASIAVIAGLSIVTFLRKGRNEFIKSVYDMKDVRDIDFEYRLKEKKRLKELEELEDLENEEE